VVRAVASLNTRSPIVVTLEGDVKVTPVRLDAALNASMLIVVTLVGIVMLVRDDALANIPVGMVVNDTFEGSVTFATWLPLNALWPMLVMLLGSVMELRLVVFRNAYSPTVVTLFGIVTLVRFAQPENSAPLMLVNWRFVGRVTAETPLSPKAPSPMLVTEFGRTIAPSVGACRNAYVSIVVSLLGAVKVMVVTRETAKARLLMAVTFVGMVMAPTHDEFETM